jgi:acetyl esterase/lipase
MSATRNLVMGVGALLAAFAYALAPAIAEPISYADLLARPRPVPTLHAQYGAAPSQFGELWLPDGAEPRPVLLMIHGGCWRADLPGLEMMAYAAEDLRQHGFAVWNVEYRRLGEPGGGYPGTFEDIADATDWLRKLADGNKLILQNVIALGHSSGGQLALWTAARRRLPKASQLHGENPLTIRAVISLAGIDDLSAYRAEGPPMCGGPRVIDFLDGSITRGPWDVFEDTSPAEMLPIGVPQEIISGALDPIVPAAFGRAYAAKAKAAGDTVEEVTIPDASHFELIDPESSAFAEIRSIIERFK